MQEMNVICPCCGHHFILPITVGGAAAKEAVIMTESEKVRLASNLGIELGALKGGEKIGD